jgi:putative transposase
MARLARIVVVNVPYHVTQRGNARQFILTSDDERLVYLELLRKYVQLHELSLLGYCLMSNHLHLVVVPRKADSLALALKNTHGRYASYWNAAHKSTGHVWQGRFYSCPLDSAHLWIALRYTERNPVRAGLLAKAESWAWSSAPAHCGTKDPDVSLEMEMWEKRWSTQRWREYLADGEKESEIAAIRKCTHTGRPLGTPEFLRSLEQATQRLLVPQKGGRPLGRSDRAQNILPLKYDSV